MSNDIIASLKDPLVLSAVKDRAISGLEAVLKTATPELRERVVRQTLARFDAMARGDTGAADFALTTIQLDLRTVLNVAESEARGFAHDALFVVMDAVGAALPTAWPLIFKILRPLVR